LRKVLIRVYTRTHVLVVLLELAESDDSVLLLGVPESHELLQGFLRRFLALDDIGMLGNIINLRNIIKFDESVPVDIEFIIGPLDPLESVLVQRSL